MGPRAVLALLLIGTFGSRVVAPPPMRGCEASVAYVETGGHGHGGHQADHEPGNDLPSCECVGQACSSATAVPTTAPALGSSHHVCAPVLTPDSARLLAWSPDHFLPFAHGPPSLSA